MADLDLIFPVIGILLAVFWGWRKRYLVAVMAVVSCLGGIFVAEFPVRTEILSNWSSFLQFLINFGTYFAMLVSTGVLGAILGLLVTGKLSRRSGAMRSVAGNQRRRDFSE